MAGDDGQPFVDAAPSMSLWGVLAMVLAVGVVAYRKPLNLPMWVAKGPVTLIGISLAIFAPQLQALDYFVRGGSSSAEVQLL